MELIAVQIPFHLPLTVAKDAGPFSCLLVGQYEGHDRADHYRGDFLRQRFRLPTQPLEGLGLDLECEDYSVVMALPDYVAYEKIAAAVAAVCVANGVFDMKSVEHRTTDQQPFQNYLE